MIQACKFAPLSYCLFNKLFGLTAKKSKSDIVPQRGEAAWISYALSAVLQMACCLWMSVDHECEDLGWGIPQKHGWVTSSWWLGMCWHQIPHKISCPYVERCVVYWWMKIYKLLDLQARKWFWNNPQTISNHHADSSVIKKYSGTCIMLSNMHITAIKWTMLKRGQKTSNPLVPLLTGGLL